MLKGVLNFLWGQPDPYRQNAGELYQKYTQGMLEDAKTVVAKQKAAPGAGKRKAEDGPSGEVALTNTDFVRQRKDSLRRKLANEIRLHELQEQMEQAEIALHLQSQYAATLAALGAGQAEAEILEASRADDEDQVIVEVAHETNDAELRHQ